MAERRLQPRFIKALFLLVFLLCAGDSRPEWPDRVPLRERVAAVRFQPLALPSDAGGAVRITGAWTVEADDPRMAGLSGLAVRDERTLVAVTDSGVLIDLPKPGEEAPGRFRDLIGGPGYPTFKKYRDAEALLLLRDPRSPDTIGFEVTFEHRHSLIHYSEKGWRLFDVPFPSSDWPANKGAEAMSLDGNGRQLILGEQGREVLVRSHGGIRIAPLTGAAGGIADAARLADGRILVAIREIGPMGLTNRLAWLEEEGRGYRLRNFVRLPLGVLDNVEGLAAEPRLEAGAILWAVTDNDGWRRTLLLRIEIAPSP